MLKKEAVQIQGVTADLENGWFVIKIKVKNPGDRTLYAYGSPRRILYDSSTGKLTLYLHDHHLTKDEETIISPHLRQPRFVPLEARAETDVKIALRPVMNRIRPAAERGTGPLFEEMHVSEAKQIEVEIAYQDTPFYYNPKVANAKQLKDWGNIVSRASFKIAPPTHRPERGGGKKRERGKD